MRNVGWTRWCGACVAATSFALAGCASEVGRSDPSSQTSSTESAGTASASDVSVSSKHHGRCSPFECCFPDAGGGWSDDPLDDRLRALGCSTPAPYEQTAQAFWVWTACPFGFPVVATVFKYSGTPYDAHFVENACLDVDPGQVAVVFDPTCPTCGPSVE